MKKLDLSEGREIEISTSAHQHICSSAHQLISLAVAISLCVFSGCEWNRSAAHAALDSEHSTSGNPTVVDAGIVLLDRDGYLCVPLQQLGISANSEPATVTSSCPCVQAEIINYAVGRGQTSRALLLTFIAESPNDLESTDPAAIRKPVELDVKIEIKLGSGVTHSLDVLMKNSFQVGGAVP